MSRFIFRSLGRGALLALFIPLFAFAPSPAARAQDEPRLDILSVCLKTGASSVEVVGVDVHLFDEQNGGLIHQEEGKHSHTLRAVAGGIRFDDKLFKVERLRLKSTQNWLSYDGHIFREDLLVTRSGEKLALINELSLEQYLYGLINKEVLPRWPLEAKKAQAVAARSYAVHRKLERPREQCDMGLSVLDQVYGGYKAEDKEARQAVDETRGVVLTSKSRVARAYFHSSCGGATASLKETWGEDSEYLRGVDCPYCKDAPSYTWTYALPYEKFGELLGVAAKARKRFTFDIVERSPSGRVLKARINDGNDERILRGEDLRAKLGYGQLKSTRFTFRVTGGKIEFQGQGSGHGVGLCQWGAAGMAKNGADYRAILDFYYPGTVLKRMY